MTDMRRIEPITVNQLVVNEILRGISVGELSPGQALPAERQLAAELGVSRVTVREALDVLTRRGYLVKRRGSTGTCMVQPVPQLSADLRNYLRQRWQALDEVIEFRTVVEGEVAALAALRRTDAQLRVLEDLQRQLDEVRVPGEFRRLDSAFHEQLAVCGGNAMLQSAVEEGRSAFFLELDVSLPRERLADYVRDTSSAHHGLLDAVRASAPDLARTRMKAHILHTVEEAGQSFETPEHVSGGVP